MNSIREKFNKYFICNRKTLLTAACCVFLFMLGWKLTPREVSFMQTPIIYFAVLVILAGMSHAVKIKMSERSQKIFSVILFVIIPMIAFCNTELIVGNNVFNVKPVAIIMNYLVYLAVFLLLQIVFNRTRISISMGIIAFTVFGIADAFVGKFRGVMIRTADIFALNTAMNVAGEYDFVLTQGMVVGALIALFMVFMSSHCIYKEINLKKRGIKAVIVFIYIMILAGLGFNKASLEKMSIIPEAWEAERSVKEHGAVLDFLAGIPFLKLDPPEGYSAEDAKKILEQYADEPDDVSASEKPNIIYIMNESFADLRVLSELQTSEEPLKYFNSLTQNVIRGNLSVPVYGGGTCNSEFEALTGFSTAFFPSGSYPYMSYVREGTDNLGMQLKADGYSTIFMHLFDGTGWNRKNVYEMFGFDEQIYLEDVPDVDLIRAFASDKSNYKELIEQYEKASTLNENVFLFNVTIQNHGSYWQGELDDLIEISGHAGEYPQAEMWLTLIDKSDEAFEELIQYFEKKEEPVIICMFGDHWPTVETDLLEDMESRADENSTEILAREYQTPFLIWANYEIETETYVNISANYLSTLLTKTAGLPLTDFQKYLDDLYKDYPVISINGVMDKDGKWYTWEEAQEFEKIEEYEKVQYYLFSDN